MSFLPGSSIETFYPQSSPNVTGPLVGKALHDVSVLFHFSLRTCPLGILFTLNNNDSLCTYHSLVFCVARFSVCGLPEVVSCYVSIIAPSGLTLTPVHTFFLLNPVSLQRASQATMFYVAFYQLSTYSIMGMTYQGN